MFAKLRRMRARKQFSKVVRGVRDTAPIIRKAAPLKFVSLMCQRDIDPYLVAIKSVYRAFGEGDIVLVNDGSLTAADIHLLETHLGSLEVIAIDDVDTGKCPRGGCWERLATLIDQAQNAFAVQVDADLVAPGPMIEAVEAYRAGRPFSLGNNKSPGRVTFREMSDWIAKSGFGQVDKIQVIGENLLSQMPRADDRFYVRASAAFTGFPKGAVSWAEVEQFSSEMEKLTGLERWEEWGSEQFASNAMIASAGDTLELLGPKYINHFPQSSMEGADLIHFFGTHRFSKGHYSSSVLDFINTVSR